MIIENLEVFVPNSRFYSTDKVEKLLKIGTRLGLAAYNLYESALHGLSSKSISSSNVYLNLDNYHELSHDTHLLLIENFCQKYKDFIQGINLSPNKTLIDQSKWPLLIQNIEEITTIINHHGLESRFIIPLTYFGCDDEVLRLSDGAVQAGVSKIIITFGQKSNRDPDLDSGSLIVAGRIQKHLSSQVGILCPNTNDFIFQSAINATFSPVVLYPKDIFAILK